MTSRRTPFLVHFPFVLLAILAMFQSIASADESLVGVLDLAVQPEMADRLRLSEDQLAGLKSVIEEREKLGLSLGAELRELPPEERELKQRQFVRDSEKLGFSKLSLQQRTQLQQIRISKLGLSSLADEEVAETVGLSGGQITQVNEILASRASILREVGRERVSGEMELRLKAVLTNQQLATWQAMSGQTKLASSRVETPSTKRDESPAGSTEDASNSKGISSGDGDPANQALDANGKVQSHADSESKEADRGSDQRDRQPVSTRDGLVINFKETPWEQVLRWVSREAELSLQANAYPPGTFTYSDPYRTYTLAEALNIMNRVLLQEGYSLLRYGRVLSVLDLGSDDSSKAELVRGYIREVAELVTPEELQDRGDYEICKCLFILSRLSPDEAKREIEQLIGPHGSVIALPAAGQVLVTETVSKLNLIRRMLNRSEDPESSLGSKILVINLKHVAAEEVLSAFRPLVNMTQETNTSADISFSTDTFGNTIYATGKAEKLQQLGDLAKKIDVEPSAANGNSVAIEQPYLETHAVISSDPDTAFDVLQTLLAGSPNVRLSKDPMTNKIIAFAAKSDHELIAKTLTTLSGMASSFTVIPLKRIDTQAAILTLEKFFGKKSSTDKDAPASASKGPTFYGDTAARVIMVQGTEDQIAQVRNLIDKLEATGPQSSLLGENMRVLPYHGKSADRVIDQVKTMWESTNRRNKIRELKPAEKATKSNRRRPSDTEDSEADAKPAAKSGELKSETPSSDETESSDGSSDDPIVDPKEEQAKQTNRSTSAHLWLPVGRMASSFAMAAVTQFVQPPSRTEADTDEENGSEEQEEQGVPGSDIVIFHGPTGLIVTSDDKQALAEFEELMRMFGDQLAMGPSEPAVIYLQFVKAAAAEELLKGILSGDTGGGGGGGGLLGNVASGMLGELGGGLLGSMLGGGRSSSGGSSTTGTGLAGGDIAITSDPRLNALIVQASPIDIDYIEQLIEVIDQEDSPLNIETRGIPRIIPVENQDVEAVANVVKQAFTDRIASGESGAQRQPSPQEFIAMLQGGRGGNRGGNGQSQLKEATMTIATDPKSNSLIVTAPKQLFDQVEALVKMLDQASAANEEQVQVVDIGGNLNPTVIQTALQSVLGPQVRTNLPNSNNNQRNQQANNANRQQGGQQQFRGQFPGGGFQAFPGGGNAMQFFQGGQGGNAFRPGGQGGQGGNFRGGQFPGNFGGQGMGGQNFGNRGGAQGGNRTGGQGGNRAGGNQRRN